MSDWESYWKDIHKTGMDGQVFWDTEPEWAAEEDLERFIHYMNRTLPLLDLGCGNGRQSRFLAQHFPKVVGADISSSAVRLAKAESRGENKVEFRVFDAVDTRSAESLHREFGDMNIYMRGVLHMIRWEDRPAFVESMGILLGRNGTLYQIELSSDSILHLRALSQDVFAQIPKVTRRVGFNIDERAKFFPNDQWIILSQGTGVNIRSIPLSDGSEEALPANFLVLRKRTPETDPVMGSDG